LGAAAIASLMYLIDKYGIQWEYLSLNSDFKIFYLIIIFCVSLALALRI
jgi:hypothetical protein